MLGVRRFVTCVAVALLVACQNEPKAPTPTPVSSASTSSRERVRSLRGYENALRSSYSPRQAPPWIDVSGADPYRILALPAPSRGFVGILRGSKALVTLDAELNELARVELGEAPSSLCLSQRNEVLVGSRLSPYITRVALGPASSMTRLGTHLVPATGVADLACGGGEWLYVLTTDEPELVTLGRRGEVRDRRPAMPGGLRLLERGRYLLESSLFERSLRVLQLDGRGAPTRELARIRHDGPIWAFDALERGSELLIAVAGAEDKPLVRAHGEFENVDSFVWLYRYAGAVAPLLALNVGEHGLIVPKAVGLNEHGGQLLLSVLAAGSGRLLRARFESARWASPQLELASVPPGASDAVFSATSVVYPSPLLDAWVSSQPSSLRARHVDPARDPEPQVRLGEALFFTSLIAPENLSAGTHSRFSCETCHFEGGVDGRTHYTGRDDVSVVTKPLFGLANNRPHFSRALDRDLSSVSHNEFRVAGAGSSTDPWFDIESARFPWLRELGIERGRLSALDLREALIAFLYAFSHDPNPRALIHTAFTELEREGARVFAQRCESCHAARIFSDDASSHAPFAEWQELVLRRNAPLVWASSAYAKTGIEPYVHERGTRVTSLRRLGLKPRYFTNGSAPTLSDVVSRFRFGPGRALHEAPAGVTELAALDEPAQRALLAFLRLL
jgi:cytochrome c peroxidase